MRINSNITFDPAAARSRTSRIRLRADDQFCDALLQAGRSIIFTCRRENLVGIISVDRTLGARVSVFEMPSPMASTTLNGTLAIGVGNGIKVFEELANGEPGTYYPVSLIETGAVSVHDLAWDQGARLLFVNTLFSAVCSASLERHFDVVWLPPFISMAEPKDRCHLNGFALRDGELAYVTALSSGHRSQSWKHEGPDHGVLVETASGAMLKGLSLPHSPTFHRSDLWYLESGKGRLCRLGKEMSVSEPFVTWSGFARGLAFMGDLAFAGISIIKSTNNETERVLRERFGDAAGNASIEIAALGSGKVIGVCDLPVVQQISSLALLDCPDPCLLEPTAAESERTFVFGAQAGLTIPSQRNKSVGGRGTSRTELAPRGTTDARSLADGFMVRRWMTG